MSQVIVGDAVTVLQGMDAGSVHCCVTSPPYFGLRDYGEDGQIGLEATPDEYVARLVAVFAEVKRVLRVDGTLWLNLGDSYAGSWGAQSRPPGAASTRVRNGGTGPNPKMLSAAQVAAHPRGQTRTGTIPAGAPYKAKDLLGIPWMVAFALRADGWYLRSEIIWAKPNPMPESVTDRPTKAHEQVFLLSKSARYYYDADAIKEAPQQPSRGKIGQARHTRMADHPKSRREVCAYCAGSGEAHDPHEGKGPVCPECDGSGERAVMSNRPEYRESLTNPTSRNKRSVWTVATQPYPEAHCATFPPKLIEPMILAGCPRGGTVLDPFAGSGTTLQVAEANGREGVGIELNAEYALLAGKRLAGVTASMFDVPLAAVSGEDKER